MLTFFRRFINSRVGLIVDVRRSSALIALAFALGDVTGISVHGAAVRAATVVAEVGDRKITDARGPRARPTR